MSTWRPESQSRHTKSTWQPKESLRSTIVGCVLAAVVIVGLLLYVQLRTPAAAPPKREITEQEFCDSARKFGKEIVLARLKAPATAVFSDNVETGLKRRFASPRICDVPRRFREFLQRTPAQQLGRAALDGQRPDRLAR